MPRRRSYINYRAIDRGMRRIGREMERQRRAQEKHQAMQQAAYEVQRYEEQLQHLVSYHLTCGNDWDWAGIARAHAPVEPTPGRRRERAAQNQVEGYRPSPLTRLLRLESREREELATAVEAARQVDEEEYHRALTDHQRQRAAWERLSRLAKRVLAGDLEAYVQAVEFVNPFLAAGELGTSLECRVVSPSLLEATLRANREQVVPTVTKTLLKSGRASTKDMPKSKYYQVYQDHVCSCVLRVARELVALLPVRTVIVTAEVDLLDSGTGHVALRPILSVAFARSELLCLNFAALDPSEAVARFAHRMKFRKRSGFSEIRRIAPDEVVT